jgi:hypothetical protein
MTTRTHSAEGEASPRCRDELLLDLEIPLRRAHDLSVALHLMSSAGEAIKCTAVAAMAEVLIRDMQEAVTLYDRAHAAKRTELCHPLATAGGAPSGTQMS